MRKLVLGKTIFQSGPIIQRASGSNLGATIVRTERRQLEKATVSKRRSEGRGCICSVLAKDVWEQSVWEISKNEP